MRTGFREALILKEPIYATVHGRIYISLERHTSWNAHWRQKVTTLQAQFRKTRLYFGRFEYRSGLSSLHRSKRAWPGHAFMATMMRSLNREGRARFFGRRVNQWAIKSLALLLSGTVIIMERTNNLSWSGQWKMGFLSGGDPKVTFTARNFFDSVHPFKRIVGAMI